jgi:predicted XRE-type DNA-binding protein
MTARRPVETMKAERSSGNVFADLDLPDADKLKIVSGLIIEITKAVQHLGLSRQRAAKRMRISPRELTGLLEGNFATLSEHQLSICLDRLR